MSLAGSGASLDFGVFTVAGTYTVTATNGSTSCANSMGGSTTVVVNALPVAYAVTGSGASYCAGGTGVTIYLSGTELGVSYQLYRGTTSVGSAVAGNRHRNRFRCADNCRYIYS